MGIVSLKGKFWKFLPLRGRSNPGVLLLTEAQIENIPPFPTQKEILNRIQYKIALFSSTLKDTSIRLPEGRKALSPLSIFPYTNEKTGVLYVSISSF